MENVIALHFAERPHILHGRFRGCAIDLIPNKLGILEPVQYAQRGPWASDHRTLNDTLQLTHVAGPAVILEDIQGFFLDGFECTVYEERPRTCEYFPHVVKGEGPITTRMWELVDRATYCPIVYNSLEAFKEEMDFQR